jgi:hypothetical protein
MDVCSRMEIFPVKPQWSHLLLIRKVKGEDLSLEKLEISYSNTLDLIIC